MVVMSNIIHISDLKKDVLNNPLENVNYLNILGLLPTLRTEIKKRIRDLLNQNHKSLEKTSLNSNNWLTDEENLKQAKQELIKELFELSYLTGTKASIKLVIDDCFTNILIIDILIKILWQYYGDFVTESYIDFSKQYDQDKFKINNNSLVIFWWSLSDTYTIDSSYYNSDFAELIKLASDDCDPNFLNIKFIWVCFWQQYMANLLWINNKHTSSIIATYKWKAQFWPSNCSIANYNYVNRVYQKALAWITNYWKNKQFSTFFTRTGYVDFDLLKTWYDLWIVPLITDDITWSIVGWWSKNWNILWVQFHPEISFLDYSSYVKENIEKILPKLEWYSDIELLYKNFNFWVGFNEIISKDVWEYFYTYAILAYVKSIKERYIETYPSSNTWVNKAKSILSYQEALGKITKVSRQRIDTILSISNPSFQDKTERLTFLKKIDESWRLLLNHKLDWKVNRGLKEVSKVLGFKNLWDILENHLIFLANKEGGKRVYFFRDWWAWDGSLLKDLYDKYKWKDIVFYWVGDYIYFDLYPSLKRKSQEVWIPEEVLILFFEDFLVNYSNFSEGNIYQKVSKALTQTELNKIHKIHNSSITSSETVMFSWEQEHDISPDSIRYIKENKHTLEELKTFVINNFYDLFEGFFERIYVSKFNDFKINDNKVSKVDFQVAIRSTSHVDSWEYKKIIIDFFTKNANPWAIYIDNWVQRSYTRVPRIPELLETSRFLQNVKINLIYDRNTNYFTSAIIQKEPFCDDSFFLEHLNPGYIIVPIEEAFKNSFFRLEYFIRNFILINFKNFHVFYNFEPEILTLLKKIIISLKNKDIIFIKNQILELINFIAKNYKYANMNYDNISLEELEKYSINNETIDSILSENVYLPDWMNLEAFRYLENPKN